MVLVALGPGFIPCLFLDVVYASFRHPALPHRAPSVDHGDYIATAAMQFFSSADTYALQRFALSATSMITALFCLGSFTFYIRNFVECNTGSSGQDDEEDHPSYVSYRALLHSKLCEYASINYFSSLAMSTSLPINMFSVLQHM